MTSTAQTTAGDLNDLQLQFMMRTPLHLADGCIVRWRRHRRRHHPGVHGQDHPQARPGWCATLHACSSAAPPRASLAVRCSLAAPMSETHRLPLTAPLIVVSIELMIDAHRSMRGSDLAGADARQALGRFLPSGSQETRPPRRAMSRSSKSSSGVPSHCRFFTSLSLPGADPWMPLFRTAHPIQGATVSSSQYAKMVIVHDLTASNG